MKRRLAFIVTTCLLALSLAACGGKKESDNSNNSQQKQEQNSQKEQEPNNQGDKKYATRINVSINPDADILTDNDGKVIEIVFNNEDAKTAYSGLEVAGKDVEEVAKEMVKAATDAGFMQDEKPVTLTIMDSTNSGRDLLDEALEVKDGVQQALTEEDFGNAPIHAEVAEQEVKDDTCDLCYGSGVVVCDGCDGTTYLDGNAWTTCEKCEGHGKTTCSLCNGEAYTSCDSCGGTGLDSSQADGKCFGCHGEGKMKCPRCGDGAGFQECEDCHGEGKLGGLPCPGCGGTLWAVCNRCGGSGKHEN